VHEVECHASEAEREVRQNARPSRGAPRRAGRRRSGGTRAASSRHRGVP
jgi:hypothetical protein